MPEQVLPTKIQMAVKDGLERMKNYRQATALFIKEYVGNYYRQTKGLSGDEPLNLIYNTVRVMVPNLVMQNPINLVTTPYLPYKEYSELLGLGLDAIERKLHLKNVLRGWIVSALFGWGIVKIGLRAKGQLINFGDVNIDPGQLYVDLVDLDDFILDPMCTDIDKPVFMGSRTMVPRQLLLDTDIYDHDLVKRLPSSSKDSKRADAISQLKTTELQDINDYVDVVELYVPEANALVTIPDPTQTTFDKYIGITDFYGPKEGPYVFLSLTPPVPGNPFPVAPISVIYDLHRAASKMFGKLLDQAERQKDVLLYNPAQADEADAIREAEDGDTIASTDPKGIQLVSYGGQARSNEFMLQQLQVWYNYMSGNPDQLAGNMTPGTKGGMETATRSQILQSNASITVEDARDVLYEQTAEISRRLAWYLHTDPLIDLPLIKRRTGGEEIQLFLTPEQRCGDFLDFAFHVAAKSMSRLDPAVRSKRIVEFATNIIPSAAIAAQTMMQLGQPFNVQKYLTQIAMELEIGDWVEELFVDPEFLQKLQLHLALGPQNPGKAGTSPLNLGGTRQNRGNPMARPIPSPQEEQNRFSQETAAESQAATVGVR